MIDPKQALAREQALASFARCHSALKSISAAMAAAADEFAKLGDVLKELDLEVKE